MVAIARHCSTLFVLILALLRNAPSAPFRSPHVALHHHGERETAHLNHLATSLFFENKPFCNRPYFSFFVLKIGAVPVC
ncbi:hypothetical protein EB093_03220 [bacterium]|nr:hypothetical protein [bacterium]